MNFINIILNNKKNTLTVFLNKSSSNAVFAFLMAIVVDMPQIARYSETTGRFEFKSTTEDFKAIVKDLSELARNTFTISTLKIEANGKVSVNTYWKNTRVGAARAALKAIASNIEASQIVKAKFETREERNARIKGVLRNPDFWDDFEDIFKNEKDKPIYKHSDEYKRLIEKGFKPDEIVDYMASNGLGIMDLEEFIYKDFTFASREAKLAYHGIRELTEQETNIKILEVHKAEKEKSMRQPRIARIKANSNFFKKGA